MATPNMNLTLPTPGTTAGPTYASDNNTAFTTIDEHDHTPGKGVRITPAALNINDDLSIGGNDLTDVVSLRLSTQGTTPTGNTFLFVKDGELTYVDDDGAEVQLTSAGSVAGTPGTISGMTDDSDDTPTASYSDTTNSYTFNYETSKPAKLNISDISIYEFDNASANPITIKSPASVTSAYSLTLPTAAASGTVEYLTVDSSGQMNHATLAGTTNQITVTQSMTAVTLSLPQNIHTGASPTFTGLTLSSTLTSTGIIRTGDGSASAPALSFGSDTNTGIYRASSDTLRIVSGGADRLTINSSGLTVSGAMAATGAVSGTTGTFTGAVTAASLNTASGGAFKVKVVSLSDIGAVATNTIDSVSGAHGLTAGNIVAVMGSVRGTGSGYVSNGTTLNVSTDDPTKATLQTSWDSTNVTITIRTPPSGGETITACKVAIIYQ